MLLATEELILGKMNTAPMTTLTSLSNMGVPTTLTNLSNMGVPTTLTNLSNVGVPSTLTNLSNIAAPSTLTSVTILNELVPLLPYGVPLTPTQVSPSQTMELVWHGEFDRLFTQYYPHAWYLVPTFYPPSDRWRVFKDSAKVRFSCQECGHGWTSMKGRVIFWFHLNYSTNSGYVMFKLYGQQCQKCKNGSYEHAMWYPEEVVKVIGNVYNRVGQVFYGFVRPPLRIDRRQGKPRNQHNAELCQACKEGLCKEEWSFS